ncbi:MAG: two-component regulator propeller domain-containing protein [Bacteroidaceae bacterium]
MKILSLIRSLLIVLIIVYPTKIYAGWNPFIIHYVTNQYGEGAHTWELKIHNGGWLYVANESGLFQFDGSTWVRNILPNHSPVRSVCIDSLSQRIYTGGINQIGYFKPDGFGKLKYTSLFGEEYLGMNLMNNVWKIDQVGSVIYFRGDLGVLRYSEQLSFHNIIEAPAKITASTVVGGSLYIGCEKGVYVLVDNEFHRLHGTADFKGHLIRSISSSKAGTLILTSDGLYIYDGVSVKLYIPELNKYLIRNDAFCMAIRDNLIAIGTINRGVLVCKLGPIHKSRLSSLQNNDIPRTSSQMIFSPHISAKFINEKNGLQNNTVLSLCFDEEGMLWAGLDRGVDFILLSSSLTNLYTFPESYGTGYSSVKYKGENVFWNE